MGDLRFIGTKVDIGGKDYIIPTLGMNAYRKHKAFQKITMVEQAITTMREGHEIGDEIFENILELIGLALKRNYPDIDIEVLADEIDFMTAMSIIPLLIQQDKGAREVVQEETKNGQKPIA